MNKKELLIVERRIRKNDKIIKEFNERYDGDIVESVFMETENGIKFYDFMSYISVVARQNLYRDIIEHGGIKDEEE